VPLCAAQVKQDPALATIPIVVFTTSGHPSDIASSYARHANTYVTKPLDLDAFTQAVDSIHDFYGELVMRPRLNPPDAEPPAPRLGPGRRQLSAPQPGAIARCGFPLELIRVRPLDQ
jgi:DNA-binding NarL/FixJ family response regulator